MINWITYHFSATYLFNKSPETGGMLIIVLTIYFTLVIIIGLLLAKLLIKKSTKIKDFSILREKILLDSLVFGIGGLTLVFIRYQQIPYFSAPIIMFIFLLVNIIVFWYIILFYIKIKKTKVANLDIEEKYQKYIPNKKTKK